jgi:hypothetical protein
MIFIEEPGTAKTALLEAENLLKEAEEPNYVRSPPGFRLEVHRRVQTYLLLSIARNLEQR